MRTIIAGSRSVVDLSMVARAMERVPFKPSVVLCGCARGADTLGRYWAMIHGIPVEYFPADWDKWGRSAGAIRNSEMSRNAEAVVAIWDGRSPGTKILLDMVRLRDMPVYIWYTQ